MRLGLNESLNSELGAGVYIRARDARFTHNFPQAKMENWRGGFAEFVLSVVGFDLEELKIDKAYYGEWIGPPDSFEVDQDNGDLTIEIGNNINCPFTKCLSKTAICEVNDSETERFGIKPIPGVYEWENIPDEQCRKTFLTWLPFID